MNRILSAVLAAAVLALAGCASGSTTASSDPAPSAPAVTHGAYVKLKGISTARAYCCHPATPKPSPSSAKACPSAPDIFVWMRTPGVPDYAQRLGGIDQQNCESSFKTLAASAPTTPGSCTQGAWVSDNPGYDPDATPAKRLKRVQFSVGPDC